MALPLMRKLTPDNIPVICWVQADLASVLNELKEQERALHLASEAYEKSKDFSSEDEGIKLAIMNRFGTILKDMAQWKSALEILFPCLELSIKRFGEDHTNVGSVWTNIGKVYVSIIPVHPQNLINAEKAFLSSISIYENKFGEKHSEVANNTGNLSEVYYRVAQFHKNDHKAFERFMNLAREKINSAIEIEEEILYPTHIHLLDHRTYLAIFRTYLWDLEDAEQYHNKVIDNLRKILGPGDGRVLNAISNKGHIYLRHKLTEKAKSHYENLKELYAKYSISDPRLLSSLNYVLEELNAGNINHINFS